MEVKQEPPDGDDMIEIHDDGVDSRDNSVSILKLKDHNLDDFNINLKLWEPVCMSPLTSLSKDFGSLVVTCASSGSIVSAIVWALPRRCLRRSSQSLSSVSSRVSFCMTFFTYSSTQSWSPSQVFSF